MTLDLSDFGLTSFIDFTDTSKGTYDAQNRISAWADSLGLINDFTQGTDANKPILTRTDNKENLLWANSETLYSGWGFIEAVVTSATTFRETLATASRYIYPTVQVTFVSGVNYRFSARIAPTATRYARIEFYRGSTQSYVDVSNTGTVTSSSGTPQNITITSVGGGEFDVSFEKVSSATATGSIVVRMLEASTGNHIYTGDGVSAIGATRLQVQRASADATYIATTDHPQIAGVNGRAGAHFSGSQVLSSTSLLSNVFTNAAKLLYVVFRPSIPAHSSTQYLFIDSANYVNSRITTGGLLEGQNYDSNYDSADTLAALTANTVYAGRFRHVGGSIFQAIDVGAGYSAETGAATASSGNTGAMTGALRIGATATPANGFYGDIVAIATANTGAAKPNLEPLLREYSFARSLLRINPFTGQLIIRDYQG